MAAQKIWHACEYREQFDLCVSRAVANLSTLAEYCLPFVRLGGKFISYKSGECENEVAAAKSAIFLLGGKVEDVYKFSIGEAQRAFISLIKANGTSKKYPRKAGMPSKNPFVIYAFSTALSGKRCYPHLWMSYKKWTVPLRYSPFQLIG